MSLQRKSDLRFALPLLLAAIYLATPGVISPKAYAQCGRPGFKLNYGSFSAIANKVVTADFNADGKVDIAATYYSGGKLAVYFGDGTGKFNAPVIYTVGTSLYRLQAADVNNDAKPDLLLFYETFTVNRIVSVLLNNGSGAFGSAVDSSFPFDSVTIRMADFNGDGKGDLAYLILGSNSSLTVRFGDGLGNFASATNYPVVNASGFVVGDFSGDGKLDVGVNRGDNGTAKVMMYLNDGSGGLVQGTETTLDNAGISLARDLNGDGKLDMAGSSHLGGSSAFMVLLNNGSGGFTRTDYPISSNIGGVRAGDFNGDGKVDLIASGYYTVEKSSTLYGNGTGGFTQGESFGSAYGWNIQGDVADFNGDGKSDLVVALGDGVRAFIRTCNDVSNTKRVDYDGDSLTDFAVWRPSTGDWIIDQSLSNTRRTQHWGLGSLGDIPVQGDYDGDGKTDLAVWRPSNGYWFILHSSDNSFRAQQWGLSEDKPVAGDYDADGKTDIAVWRPSNGIWYILRSSDEVFQFAQFGTNGDKPAQADFDNDDKTDLAVFRPSNGYWFILHSSDGSYTVQQWGLSGDKPVPADYDGDGKADIAVYRPGVAFYFLNSWDNNATGVVDSRYAGTPSAADVPAPMQRFDYFTAYIWRPASTVFGTLSSTTSGQIGMSGDIPVVAPYVIE